MARSEISILVTRFLLWQFLFISMVTKMWIDLVLFVCALGFKILKIVLKKLFAKNIVKPENKNVKVAIIGSGIAGSSCAWALQNANF